MGFYCPFWCVCLRHCYSYSQKMLAALQQEEHSLPCQEFHMHGFTQPGIKNAQKTLCTYCTCLQLRVLSLLHKQLT